ncbi:Rha family transcriptional regulator [Escherichia coli]|nr:peptidase [Escherichia coli]EFO0929166.1 peptidase [Escherichia coli O157]EFR17838.1 phage regulatory, Rha family protein [Escherichia coli 2362-75]EHU03430.1 phage regulatory, Rha family protein [Escherichia coli DEC1A]EHU03538.1 phage regulatory, Rha family protein [Escherichia coli DEC1C]EHU05786.1 phage regulatory, Rha family protein [Escherichia coli DEC1B]EHU21798.1 phage regulatory, Rha family protein [Escherichia coli DEC2A]EHU34541.1 phage regulatory, Rha family protein [Escheric
MNSLTANNRLSQQLVVSVAEHLLLRHECRLPNHLAVSNHRELYLTVGGELCRNLTAGFVTEEGFMSMLFVGSQKHSALSIFAKTTRMSALVLCGNSGVILLSVKDHQHIDSAIPGRYTVQAPYKAGAGIGVLKLITEHNRAHAVFSCHEHCYAQIMVGRTGPTSVGPGSVVSGNANPVRLTTSVIGVPCGEFSEKLTTGAVTMTTLPTLSQPEIAIVDGQAVTSSLAVADFFSKRHDDVLKKIRILDCSPEFCARNFAETSILVHQPNGGTRKLPCYHITRDGFAFLAMGFTGKRAAQFKEAYINAFNQMEKQLSKPSVPSDVAHNASVLYSYISSIHQVWLQQLYPMLEKAESPLAVSLYDRINDAAFLARLIHSSLNSSEVRGRK